MTRQQDASIGPLQPTASDTLPAANRSGLQRRIGPSPKPRLRRRRNRRLLAAGLLAFFALVLPSRAQDDDARPRDPIGLGPKMPKVAVPTVFHYTRFNWHPEATPEAEAKKGRITFHAWLANPLKTPLENVTATLRTRQSAIKIIKGTLHFAYVRANSAAPADDTFTIENDSTAKLDFDDFIWTVGLRLAGQPTEPASKAIVDLPPVGVDSSQIQGSVILTRMDVRLTPGATVEQVNAALAKVGGQIVSMRAGDPAITISVPKQASPDVLRKLADTLKSQPGISSARPAIQPQPQTFTTDGSLVTDATFLELFRFLMPSRFPAAINAGTSRAGQQGLVNAKGKCRTATATILLPDFFGASIPEFLQTLVHFAPPAGSGIPYPDAGTDGAVHGYVSGAVIEAANPFLPCLNVVPIQIFGLTLDEESQALADEMNNHARFIVSRSMGFPNCEPETCPAPDGGLTLPVDRAEAALTWKQRTQDNWPNFLMVNAAGNEADSAGANIFPGVAQSAYESEAAISEGLDPLFGFVSEAQLWNPQVAVDGDGNPYFSLTATSGDVTALDNDVVAAGLTGSDAIENNVITVGSLMNEPIGSTLTAYVPPELLSTSLFSSLSPDTLAVGEQILDSGAGGVQGTSFSAPQVAALAAYLWLLSPDLHLTQPIEATRQAILANTRHNGIDAYASVLSLDQAVEPTPTTAPIRLALLDADGDLAFTDKDIAIFLRFLYFVDGAGNITHDPPTNTNADFSRYDLNGDGFTTSDSSHTERFDLDRVGSTQYGATSYSIVTQKIEDQTVSFVESALTDVEILCYYAYSPLYTGNNNARKSLLFGRCGISIDPKTSILSEGQKQQFTVVAPEGVTVTWSADCGAIDQTGLYTATVPGTCKVTATSDLDKNVKDTAIVTVQGGFSATIELGVEISGLDDDTGDPIFPTLAEEYVNGDTQPPPPYTFSKSGMYQRNGNFMPTSYSINTQIDGPATGQLVTGGLTYSGNVGCSASGTAATGANGDTIPPAAPLLDSDSGGAINVSIPAGGLNFSVSGLLTRGKNTGTASEAHASTFAANVSVEWLQSGVLVGQQEFKIGDGLSPGDTTPSEVTVSVGSMRLPGPGALIVNFEAVADCQTADLVNNSSDVARGGSYTITVNLSQ